MEINYKKADGGNILKKNSGKGSDQHSSEAQNFQQRGTKSSHSRTLSYKKLVSWLDDATRLTESFRKT